MIAAIEASALADWAGSEALVYPVANTAHVIGAVLLVGGIGLLDLRLLGYGRRLAPQTLAEVVTPLALVGFGLMVVSGGLMFAADARAMAASPLFAAKLGLIGLAGVNAVAFCSMFRRLDGGIPPGARILAAVSLALWLGVVVLGRLVAYF
ncbi:hypothetical protein [Brevundimonas sp.]|uniref:hypothetical protein n=2 Tax=Brevundimonas sp. TaxID=1871086 RepID=UPI00391B38D6